MTVYGGDIIYAADMNAVSDASLTKPIVRLVQGIAQSLTNNTSTAISFTTEAIDTHNFHDGATNNTRITPTVAGYYRATGRVVFTGDADYTILEARIGLNGSIQPAIDRELDPGTSSSTGRGRIATTIVSCNGTTDYVELYGLQANTSAGANDTAVTGGYASVLELEYLRGL